MPVEDTMPTMTIPELIALLSKAPAYTKWFIENRTLKSVNYKDVNELISINLVLGKGFNLTVIDGDIPLSNAARATLNDDFTMIIKDGKDIFFALTAQEVTTFDIADFIVSTKPSAGFTNPNRYDETGDYIVD